jgi:hypothetical protein
MQDARDAWRTVRRRRANPPALAAANNNRKQVFQSALAQAEELWDAAVVVGPGSRPLPLFYCLSQAGRAVCAAWVNADPWEPSGHGLRSESADGPDPVARVLEYEASVTRKPGGSFSMVAEATASASFSGKASIAQLWTSLPGLPTPRDIFGDRPRCLVVEAVRASGDRSSPLDSVPATHCRLRVGGAVVSLEQLPDNYPTTEGIEQAGTRRNVLGLEEPIYRFVQSDGSLRPIHEVGLRPFYSDLLSTDYLIRPRVGTEPIGPPSEFLSLWALLFCLSGLARYHPDTWVGVLDPDRSIAAVTLEHGLEIALQRAPALIAEALSGPMTALLNEDVRRRIQEATAAAAADVGGEDPGNEAGPGA